MDQLTPEELACLRNTVAQLNQEPGEVTYRLVEIKGTYYIHPQFPAHDK